VDGSIGAALSHAPPLLDAQGGILEWFGTANIKNTGIALDAGRDRVETI
jgi:hypothetical protein